jgi:hypothetical protein
MDEWSSTEHVWHDTDMEQSKYSEKSQSQYNSVHQKSHINWPGTAPGPTGRLIDD